MKIFAVVELAVDVGALKFVAGTVVPLLVGLLAKRNASASVKAILNLGLSAIAGALATVIQANGHLDVGAFVTGMGVTWLTSIVSYYGLWKPTGTADRVQELAPNVGIGKPDVSAGTVTADVVKAGSVEAKDIQSDTITARQITKKQLRADRKKKPPTN